MRNKLQSSVAVNHLVFLTSPFKLKFSKQKLHIGKIQCIVLFTFFLLFSGKSFAQLSQNFDSGIPANWTLFGNNNSNINWSSTTDGYLGTNAVSVNPSADNIGDQNTGQYFLVSPQLSIPENGEIHFYTKQASEADNGAQYEIRISTGAQPDINGFNVVLQSYTETTLNQGAQTNYEKKVIEIPPGIPTGLDIYIAFVAINTQNGATPSGDEWFVDDFAVLEGCEELEDDNVLVDGITVNGAEISWSHPSATDFEIQVLPTDGVPAASGIPISGTSYTLNNLDEDTEYDVYLAAICNNDTESAFTGPYTFKTLKYGLSCGAPIDISDISSTPYILQDNLANWTNPDVVYSTQGSNCVLGSSTTNYLAGNKIFLSYTAPQDGLISLTQTTFVEPGGGGDSDCYNSRSSLFVYDSCEDVGVSCVAGVTTSASYDPKTISNLLVTAGQTYIIVVSSELSSSAGICFSLEVSAPTCAPPSAITYSNLTDSSVNFSWDNIGSFSDSWEYIVVPANSGEPTTSGTATTTNTNVAINTGLESGTSYDLYVRSICGGTPGIWSTPVSFTTLCSVFDTPYATSFDNANNANPEPCWTTIDANGDGTTWAFIGGYATVQTNNSQYSNHDYYVTPQINFDGTQKRIRYKYRATQGVSTYTLKLSTTGVGVEDFTTELLPPTTVNNTSFQEIIVDIPETVIGNVNIAFVVEPNTTETALRFSIDDVVIEDRPTCPDPLNPFVLESSITTDSAWLLWTAGDEETQWEVAIQNEGTGIPTEAGLLVSSNFPYIASGLNPGTRYEFYVRAYCGEDDTSMWVGPVTFTTLCESYDTPFFESFNDEDAGTQKFCWEIIDANNDGNTWLIDESHALLQTSVTSPPSEFNDFLITPAINLDGVKELTYKYRADFSFFAGSPRFGLEVLMSTTNTNPSSFSVISPLEIFTNSSYEEKSLIIEGSGTVYIAFRVPPEFTGSWSVLSLDDVSIQEAPSCPNPTDIMVDTVLTDSAGISWSAGYNETSWEVAVQLAGSGVPSGSGALADATNFTASNLNSDKDYEVYVRAICDSGDSEWVGPVMFRTLCTAFTAPFVETFNSDSESENCWIVINDNSDDETWELNSGSFPYEGDQAAAIFTGSNGQNEDWLISPTITITENQRLRYYYRVNDSFFTEDLEVLLSTNGVGLEEFTTVLYDSDDDTVLINNTAYKVKIINFPAGISGDVNIAFHVPYFASTNSYRGQTLVIDNVHIEDVPECPEPTNMTLSAITDTSVQVGWEANGSETAWEISVQPAGSEAPVGDTDPSYLFEATTNPFTISGLEASTMYDIYVRAVCSGSTGMWTGPSEVTTKCSFENLCQYTFVLTSDGSTSSELLITQNNQVSQALPFTGEEDVTYNVLLCSGVEFSLYFDTIGWSAPQYANYQFDILNDQGVTIYSSPTGLIPRTTVYTGTSICGDISCPQPTDLTINEFSELSWTPAGSETQWEVAIQPLGNATIPQSGTVVSTNSYTPVAADFSDPNAATYEYFVRALCSTEDESYWSGPYIFVRNDDVSKALTLPINDGETCEEAVTTVSFINASASPETMSCDGVNGGDVWFSFTAESLIHAIEINSFNGDLRDNNGNPVYPEIVMTLYKDNGGGSLEEISCSYDNLLLAMYSSELIVGQDYKLRLTLNSDTPTAYNFNICVKMPEDLCAFDTINGGFEEPALSTLSGVNTIISMNTVPGWRSNLTSSNNIFVWESLNAPGFEPYEGSQCVQLLSDQEDSDANDSEIRGYYRDFDSSEITTFEYSFAHLARFDGNTIELFAGPIGGPYTLVTSHLGLMQAWEVVTGTYEVPEGQQMTRFIFRALQGNDIGNVLDAVNFSSHSGIVTTPITLECDDDVANVEASGVGTWVAAASNPGTVTIADANSNTTSFTDFVQPGVYSFTWQTAYCAYDLEITYNGIADQPTVESIVEYCLNDTAQPLEASASDVYDLWWFTDAVGGTGSTTAPTPDTSVAATLSYYVAYVDTQGCEGPRSEIEVVVSDSFTPELTFTYNETCVVAIENPTPQLAADFATGGVFSSTTLDIEASTGVIDMASASAGQHEITYTFNGDATTCTAAGTYTATIDFTAATTPVTLFDYGASSFCVLEVNTVLPSFASDFTEGGVYSSLTLAVNATTGALDLSTATVGNHEVTYSVEANAETCMAAGTFIVTLSITESSIPVTSFSYQEDVYCADSTSIFPEFSPEATLTGMFSAEAGLTIDPVTGEINIAASSMGNYNVVYEVLDDVANCVEGTSSTFNITILDAIEATIEGACDDADYVLTAMPVENSYSVEEANYTWRDGNGTIVGDNSEVFNVSDYAASYPEVTVPLQFSLTVDFGGCSVTTTYTTERLSCKEIPRGISPDGNGKNDTFDLTGFGVQNLQIFNRHGREVYNFSGNYTSQWKGQSNAGEELPDGTYFYRIDKEDGTSATGWVFINRVH